MLLMGMDGIASFGGFENASFNKPNQQRLFGGNYPLVCTANNC